MITLIELVYRLTYYIQKKLNLPNWSCYILIGALLATPYTILSDGNWPIGFLITLLVAPQAVLLIGMIGHNSVHEKGGGIVPMYVVFTYLCLPVILNLTSIVLRYVDLNVTADFLHEYRYWSLPFLWAADRLPAFIMYDIPCIFRAVRDRRKRKPMSKNELYRWLYEKGELKPQISTRAKAKVVGGVALRPQDPQPPHQ